MGGFLQSLMSVMVVPPVNLLVIALLAVLLGWRRIAITALGCVLALAMPVVSDSLLSALEHRFPRGTPAGAGAPGAIVILGADTLDVVDPEAPDGPARTDLGGLTLQRLRAGAAMHRKNGLPVLVTGGILTDTPTPAGEVMARSLRDDFGINARWQENEALDTWGNAGFSAPLLKRDGITSVYIVTHAWHMPRALLAFAGTGVAVTAAPLPPAPPVTLGAEGFVPRASALQRSYFALHEWIGLVWYGLRYFDGL